MKQQKEHLQKERWQNTHLQKGDLLCESIDEVPCISPSPSHSHSYPAFDAKNSLVLHESFRMDNSCNTNDSKVLECLLGEYLADVFVVWECYTNRRMNNTPLLLRFENYDVIVFAGTSQNLSFWRGSVNTAKGIALSLEEDKKTQDNNAGYCLAWIAPQQFLKVTGSQVKSTSIDRQGRVIITFDRFCIHLKADNDSVLVSVKGRLCYPTFASR